MDHKNQSNGGLNLVLGLGRGWVICSLSWNMLEGFLCGIRPGKQSTMDLLVKEGGRLTALYRILFGKASNMFKPPTSKGIHFFSLTSHCPM